MILKIKHSGLRRFWETEQTKGLNADWIKKVKRILFALDLAATPSDMDLPGFRLHTLKGKLTTFYAVDVTANQRIIFRFEDRNVTDVDLVDYH